MFGMHAVKHGIVTLMFAVLWLAVADAPLRAYDNYLYDNLQRSRDALLGQKDELNRARADSLAQIDRLNQKVARIDAYLRQIDDSLRDINDSLSQMHY